MFYAFEGIIFIRRTRRNAETQPKYYWPSGVVPYRFQDNYPEYSKKMVMRAFAALEEKVDYVFCVQRYNNVFVIITVDLFYDF